jgi:hypothetical protein
MLYSVLLYSVKLKKNKNSIKHKKWKKCQKIWTCVKIFL